MIKNHSRPRKTHNLSDFTAHFRYVTVSLAITAKSLGFHIWAFVGAHFCIFIKFGALAAKRGFAFVFLTAVNPYHITDNSFFALALSFDTAF